MIGSARTTPDSYPSRNGTTTSWIPRRDPVVYGPTGDIIGPPLDRQSVRSYEESGYLVVDGLISEQEAIALRREVERLASSDWVRGQPSSVTEPGSNELRSLFSIHTLHAPFRELAEDPRILDIVRLLLNDEVYIHQSRINIKPAFFGKEFFWHSDFETWHVEDGMPGMRAISCCINLTDNTRFNGPLMLIPGSHKHFVPCVGETPRDHYRASLKRQQYGTPDPGSLSRLIGMGGIVSVESGCGSALLFDCNLMHASSGNLSPWPRTNLFFVYNAVSNQLVDPFSGLPPRPDFIATRGEPASLGRR